MLFCTKELFSGEVTATTNTDHMELLQTTMLSAQCKYNVTTGSFSLDLQESNDGVNYKSISGASIAVSATGSDFIKLTHAPSRYYRIRAVRTSGTIDSLTVTIHTKGV